MELLKPPKRVIFSTEWNYTGNQMAIFQITLSHLAVPGQPEQTMCVLGADSRTQETKVLILAMNLVSHTKDSWRRTLKKT